MKLTYREKAGLAHLLILFPLVFIAIYPETLVSMDPDLLKRVVVLLILVASMYHVYNLLYIEQLLK